VVVLDKLVRICPVRPLLNKPISSKLTSNVKLLGIGLVRLLLESSIHVKLTSFLEMKEWNHLVHCPIAIEFLVMSCFQAKLGFHLSNSFLQGLDC
jgi:hypothetical protein